MTRKFFLIAGVAGLALTSPAAARPDKADRGNGGGARVERVQQPQREQRAERPQMQRIERAERPQIQRMERTERPQRQRIERAERPRMQRFERAERPQGQRTERAERPRIDRAERLERRADRVQRVEKAQRAERREVTRNIQRLDRRGDNFDRRALAQRIERSEDRLDRRLARADNRIDRRLARADHRTERRAAFRPQGLPHLTGRHDMRPMGDVKAAQRIRLGDRIAATSFAAVPAFYGTRYADDRDHYYRYDDDYGYVYRVDRDNGLVNALLPLFGGYNVGDPWPVTYRSSYVPVAYQPYYYDTSDYYYRYDGNAIYRIDAGTQLIAGIVALLSGNQLGVGQLLPASYGVYNVPLAYRSSYYDTDDTWYRYGDGTIYQVDPFSRRIQASYPLYAGYDDYLIGERWPVAYPDYNVPSAYRDTYYDTPDYQYRYANGAIYQIDPTTQLIRAIAALVTGDQFAVGQPLPSGYGVYNVPFDYRDRYADNEDTWYRYADGYVYRVDADTGLIEDAIPVYA